MSEYEFSSQYMDTKRLETLVDGLFAIAMTIHRKKPIRNNLKKIQEIDHNYK